LGNTVAEFWGGIKGGRLGIGPITRFDTTQFKVKIGAEVKDFRPENYMEKKETKRMDLYAQYALASAVDAVSDAGLGEDALKGSFRAGVYFGSGIGGLITMQEQVRKLVEKGPDRVGPLFIPMTIANMAAGLIALRFGIHGASLPVVSACATGVNTIGEAARAIRHGYLDIAIAGGAEATITEMGIAGFTNLTALSESNDPARASIPFDRDRAGFVMGEGSGALILESLDNALARNANIYAEVAGYGATSDAYHMTAPLPDGAGAAGAMRLAMEDAEAGHDKIGYINAHGTGTPANDLPETLAVKSVFGDMAYNIPFSSTKSMTGHMLGAAGAAEAIVCTLALRDGFVPPTIGLENPGEGCDLDYVKGIGRNAEIDYALTTSLGFGGHNACLCLKKWEGQ
jgi:3-oxoacyl-[acyl-carrier-protein] synthase II